MSSQFLSCLLLACAVSLSYAAEGCDASFTEQDHDCARIADSLRPDKGGQARVFAVDPSEFTAGQARWLQGQLHKVAAACVRNDQAQAAQLLAEVQELLTSHHRAS
jgi:alkyl sulfatase BDS1-like metallo-beta-lactamase superfamily hydrolase